MDDHVLEALHVCSVWINADDFNEIGTAAQKVCGVREICHAPL